MSPLFNNALSPAETDGTVVYPACNIPYERISNRVVLVDTQGESTPPRLRASADDHPDPYWLHTQR